MADTLIWDMRGGVLRGLAASRWIRVSTLSGSAGQAAQWEHTFELRAGRHAAAARDGGYVLTSVQHMAVSTGRPGLRRLVMALGAPVVNTAAKDDPRAGGATMLGGMVMNSGDPDLPVILGRLPNPATAGRDSLPPPTGPIPIPYPNLAAIVIQPFPQTTWPALGITVMLGWEQLVEALSQTRQVSIVVEV